MFEITHRHFLSKLSTGIGGAALASIKTEIATFTTLAQALLNLDANITLR